MTSRMISRYIHNLLFAPVNLRLLAGIAFTVLCLLFFLSPLVSQQTIYSGDEPHYLIALNSVINDHDFDLSNNYLRVSEGFGDAGARFLYAQLAHHTVFVKKGEKPISWLNVFNMHTLARNPDFADISLLGYTERPNHPHIVTLIYVLFMYPLLGFMGTEQAALVVTELFAVAGIGVFWILCSHYFHRNKQIVATLLFAFCTPFWFYARTLYSEVLTALLLLLSLHLVLRGRAPVITGFLTSILIGIKISFIPVPLIFLLYMWYVGRKQELLKFGLGFSLFLGIFVLLNYFIYYDPLYFSIVGNVFDTYSSLWGQSVLEGIWGTLASPSHGILPFAPYAIFALFSSGAIFVKHKYKYYIIILITLSMIILYSLWKDWGGGYSFANRFAVPVMSFLVLLAYVAIESTHKKILRYFFYVLVLYSFILHTQSVFTNPELVVDRPPIVLEQIGFTLLNYILR